MELLTVLHAALGTDTTQRNQAEVFLKGLETTHTEQYLVSLAAVLIDGSKDQGMRQLAGILIKNALSTPDEGVTEALMKRWFALSDAARAQVKGNLIAALGAPEPLPRSAAAQCIAKIGGMELCSGQWLDLPPMLLGHAANPSTPPAALHAVLMTMGYLLEEVEAETLKPEQIEQVVGCFVMAMGVDRPVEIQQVAAASMLSALPLASLIFSDEKVAHRDLVMGAICNATQMPDMTVRLSALECISAVATLYYGKLAPYMDVLFQITVASVSREELVAIRSLDFWNSICQVEIDIANEESEETSRDYAAAALPVLFPLVTGCMLKQPDRYDEDYTLSMAGSLCLGLIAQATGDRCLSFVTEFMKVSFDNPDWHHREAAVMVLGNVMEGPSDEALSPYVKHFAPLLVARLGMAPSAVPGAVAWLEPHPSVRDTTCWCLAKVLVNQFEAVELPVLSAIVDTMTVCLKDEPRVVVNACYCLNVMINALASKGLSAAMSPRLGGLVTALGEAQAREDWDEDNMRDNVWVTVGFLLKNTADEDLPFVRTMLTHCLGMLTSSLAKPLASMDDRVEQFSLQASLCGVVQTIINRLEGDATPFADQIMTLLVAIFSFPGNTAVEDGMMAVSALANHSPAKFPGYLDALHPHLLSALRECTNLNVCVAAIAAVGDVGRAVGKDFLKYSDLYVTTVFHNLQHPDVNRLLKPPLLAFIADLALALGPEFGKYLQLSMEFLGQASTAECDPDDEDEVEFVTELRIAVLEAYTGIVQGYAKDRMDVGLTLVKYLPEIVRFCQSLTAELRSDDDAYTYGRNPEIIQFILGLLADIPACIAKPTWIPLFNSSVPWVYQLIQWQKLAEEADDVPEDASVYSWAIIALKP